MSKSTESAKVINITHLTQRPATPARDNAHRHHAASTREQVLIDEIFRQARVLQRMLNRLAEDRRLSGEPANPFRPANDPDSTIIEDPFVSTPLEVVQDLSMNVAELKGRTEIQAPDGAPGLKGEENQLLAHLGRTSLGRRLDFFGAFVVAQSLTLFGILIAFVIMRFGPAELASVRLADLLLVSEAQAALAYGDDAVRAIMAVTAAGLVSICLFAYAASIYIMFLSRKPTKAQVDLAKFYSGFCTGLLTHIFNIAEG